jgi:sulfur transfer protein SufE
MQFEGKERRRILAADLKFTSHRSLRQQLVRSRSRGGAKGWIISMRS